MEIKPGARLRAHIAKNGEILYRDAPIELKASAEHSTVEQPALRFDIFPPSRPDLSVGEVCQLVVDDEQLEIKVIESRPFAGETFVVCFLHAPAAGDTSELLTA